MYVREIKFEKFSTCQISLADREMFSSSMETFLNETGEFSEGVDFSNLYIAYERYAGGAFVVLGAMEVCDEGKVRFVDLILLSPCFVESSSIHLHEKILNGILACLYEVSQSVWRNREGKILLNIHQSQQRVISMWMQDNADFVREGNTSYVRFLPKRAGEEDTFPRDRIRILKQR